MVLFSILLESPPLVFGWQQLNALHGSDCGCKPACNTHTWIDDLASCKPSALECFFPLPY